MPVWWLLLLLFSVPKGALSQTLSGHTVWGGVVRVDEDVFVPAGSSLELLPGTRVVLAAAPGTKTDPAFWNGGTELAVEGVLTARGTDESPVVFEGEGAWGGIVSAPGATVWLEHVRIRGAQEALLCVDSGCGLRDVVVSDSDYGLVAGPGARFTTSAVRVEGGRVGVLDLRGESAEPLAVAVSGTADAPLLVRRPGVRTFGSTAVGPPSGPTLELLGDYTVEGRETWRGEVIVNGKVTVVPGAVLTIAPGTRVAFRRRGDEPGKGELLILGGLRCRGTAGAPVVFESAEVRPRPGDWDKLSLISSEDPDNALEYAVFRHGTQALHAHFSRFRAENCYFEQNLRGVQFQECADVVLRRCVFYGNKQALRFRDSTVAVVDSVFVANLYGVHAFRAELRFAGNTVEDNALGGLLAKESRTVLTGNRFKSNRDGVRLRDAGSVARIEGNRFDWNAEDGLSLSGVEGVVAGNQFSGSGLDLVSVEDSAVGVSRNVFGASGRDAVRLKGRLGLHAERNDWGTADPAGRIHDGEDDPSLGFVVWTPVETGLRLAGVPEGGW